ncbi:N-acetyllactosaminide beta-1,3-N-acetylglucosaminyltransferase 2 [Thalassophryne amazonica]|uniref:N-acetyllactosaminide beta-1,3-N-acetylglucosaminyltransferase 2 n=1 Tax=Thalassophryne amazonica TaxID=390379 RepID=UPI001471CCC1|nr:N-acetyllactosaminide beta-1,3-N-acetylglucosaminyltransferase 2 [Thalassophryne amazonica]
MRRVPRLIVVFIISSLVFIFFYISLKLEAAYRPKAVLEDFVRHFNDQVQDSVVTVHFSKTNVFSVPPDVGSVSVSDGFRTIIPVNSAYWNRQLHSVLRQLDNGEHFLQRNSNWSHCEDTNQDQLQTNIHDFSSYPYMFQEFVRGMHCISAPILISQTHKCTSNMDNQDNQIFLLFAVKSSPENFVQRQAVRETWGREGVYLSGLRVRTVFLLGSAALDDPILSPLLSFEANQYGDLLQWDFLDSFLNLTLKFRMFLQWSLKNCPHVSFVFSGDDDVFVNTPAILHYLASLDPSKASQIYMGQVITPASPLRDPKSKYYIPVSFYDGPYPEYTGGGGFVFSGSLLQPLYSISRVIPFYPIDDVYTGMCVKALGIVPKAHTDFHTFDIKKEDRENLCVHKYLFLAHQRTPQEIKKLWKGIHNGSLICKT